MNNKKVSVFIAGCQKTGSTWLYKCFIEHPQIFVPEKDAIHYFTINHDLGHDWYHKWYGQAPSEQLWCDGTPSYIRDAKAAQRIFDYNPDAKLIFVIRNPVERAFSHYWHMKRKGLISYSFEDMLYYNQVGNIDLFQMWYYSSQYSNLLKPFLETFPRTQIHISLFDDLKTDPKTFLSEILSFVGIDSDYEPSVLQRKVNSGSGKILTKDKRPLRKLLSLKKTNTQVDEYKIGVNPELEKRLIKKFLSEIDELETLIGQDLSKWKVTQNG